MISQRLALLGATLCILWICRPGLGGGSAASEWIVSEGPGAQEWRFDPATGTWVPVEAAPPGTAGGDLAAARQDFTRGSYSTCLSKIKNWLKKYGADDPLHGEATVLKARALMARQLFHQAHQVLNPVLEEAPSLALLDEVLHYEFVIAEAFLNGAKREFLGMAILPGEELGLQILDDMALNYPENSVAELAIKTRADYYFREADYTLAEFEYSRLAQQFPRSRYLRLALLKSADSALASFSGVEYDDAPLIEAEERYSNYLTQFPETPEQEKIKLVLQDIFSQRAAKEFEIARYYERAGRPRAAAFYYQSCVDHWPATVPAEKAAARLAELPIPPKSEEPSEPDRPAEPVQPPPESDVSGADQEISGP